MQRSEDGCDMRRFRSFTCKSTSSTCKTVLNLLEAVYLRLRKIVVERVTVVKFRVDMMLKYLYTKVKVIHFGTNRFLIYDTSYRLSIVTFALGRTV